MPTMIERETRLVDWLRTQFPNRRVAGSLTSHRDARRRGFVRPPEVRVVLREVTADGRARWNVEFAVADMAGENRSRTGTEGVLAGVEQLHESLARDSAFLRSLGGRARIESDAYLWEETLEESWTAGARVPQAIFAWISVYGYTTEDLAAGATDLGAISVIESPDVGDHLFITDGTKITWLGPVEEFSPNPVTRHPTTQNYSSGSVVYILHEPLTNAETAEEIASYSTGESDRFDHSMEGKRIRTLLAPESYQLTLQYEAIPEAEAPAWPAYFRARRDRAVFVAGLSDQSLCLVAPDELLVSTPRVGGTCALSARFFAEPFAWHDQLWEAPS